jgi:hypothetical protein
MVSTGFQQRIAYFSLHRLSIQPQLALACGLVKIPSSRRTFDRRLKTIFTDIKQRISTMRHLFVAEGIVDISITAIDRVHSLKSKR